MTSDWSDSQLASDLEEIERKCGGVLALSALNIGTGAVVRFRGDRRCKTASVIKLPILTHIALTVSDGKCAWNETLRLTNAEKVGGSGVLNQLTEGLELTLRDLAVLMTIVSDNTATNMLIERFTVEPINTTMRTLGLPLTTLYRKSYAPDTEASRLYGLGMTTPDEMLELLRQLAVGTVGGSETSGQIIAILEAQSLRDGIPRGLPPEWRYAGKTGGVDGVRNDVGLVTGPDGSQIALAIFSQELADLQWTPDNAGLLAIGRAARRLLRTD